jgi:hypothetical protein
MVEAAKATPGHTDIATSTAASRKFPVPRMLGSLLNADLVSLDDASAYREVGRLYTEPKVLCNPLRWLGVTRDGTGAVPVAG